MKRNAPLLSETEQKQMTKLFWIFALLPFFLVAGLLLLQSEDDLPPVSMLDNPPELQASLILAKKSVKEDTVIGRFWQVNRTSVKYREISPFVTDALISTEDERFIQHSGVDFRALARSFTSFGRSGGASTIPQQLAKLLFTFQQRRREEIARASGTRLELPYVGGILGKFRRVNEKARENIIAKRLEERFTKEEIITMYLNQFDFLYNAVGIENAARVYFDKRPKDLSKSEAATLIGLCKNPSIYNPYSYQIRNYRAKIAESKGVPAKQITKAEILAARAADSTVAHARRNQVLYQWLKNSEKGNEALRSKISREEYNKLIQTPIVVRYRSLDHKEGMAPYFRKELRTEVQSILLSKKADGTFKYLREDGNPYDIDADGLKIYTTLNPTLQRYAEDAVERHINEELQPQFDLNNKGLKNYPFSNSIKQEVVEQIMTSARHNSDRYKKLVALGLSEAEINKEFNVPVEMTVFSLKGERDTVMSPNDSIRYYKAFLHAGMVSIDPRTGFVKAWVGGINFKHFGYDHVRQGKRQVGSTIKPFVYAAALSMKVVNPCTGFSADEYCLDLVDHNTNKVVGQYCPAGPAAPTVRDGLAQSSNKVTVAVMGRMGNFNPVQKTGGPYQIEKLLKKMEINLHPNDVVPSMCLGSMDLSLLQMVAAQCVFPNNGIYIRPTFIERITDRNGKVIYSATEHREQALNATVAYEMLKMMKGVVNFGTAGSLRGGRSWGGISAPTAGKTGTTQNNSDGWFVGITPELVTGVWVGAEDRAVRFKSMTWGQGGRMALPIYGYYMQKVYKDPGIALSTRDFDPPADYDPSVYDCTAAPQPETVDESEIPFEF
ncbi:MAG: transglycosylase domain-containing protein [Sphingomonadales bacterium]